MFPNKPKVDPVSTLYAKLPEDEASRIREVIVNCGEDVMSANEMLQSLRKGEEKAEIFYHLYKFLGDVEGIKRQKYTDVETGDMVIGIGLDLNVHSDEALNAIFTASFDSKRKWDLETIRKTKSWLEDGLSDDEINKLLCYALIGITNKKGTFVGLMPQLISHLKDEDKKIDLRDTPFRAHQLVALQSLAYNGPELVGEKMREALQRLADTGEDLGVLEDMTGNCNREHNPGLQNRHLKEVALFHGRSSAADLDVHLTIRQYQKIASKFRVNLINGPVVWGIPSGDEQQTFQGGDKVKTVPSFIDDEDDNEIFGSYNPDRIIATTDGSPALYGGKGGDTFIIPDAKSTGVTRWTYLAGGEDNDLYSMAENPGNVFIYDSDREGRMTRHEVALAGIIVDGQMSIDGITYKFDRVPGPDDTYWMTIKWGTNSIVIPNYVNGQFNLLWAVKNIEEVDEKEESTHPKQQTETKAQSYTDNSQTSSASHTTVPWYWYYPVAAVHFVSSACSAAYNSISGYLGAAPVAESPTAQATLSELNLQDIETSRLRAVRNSTFHQPLSFNEWITVTQYLIGMAKKYSLFTWPWNRQHKLSDDEVANLERSQKVLFAYKRNVTAKRSSLVGESDNYVEEFDYLEREIPKLIKLIRIIINTKKNLVESACRNK
ncbi:MAG: hypothetical protein M1561_00930 [Gammaproteobacteria bacterium]|nr:hypothetical protein [Gammaproteobacteria bacterium]